MDQLFMNRFGDGRFKDKRARFESQEIAEVLEKVKQERGLTWSEFADEFDVSTYTLRHDWRNNSDSIPLQIAERLSCMFDENLDIVYVDAFHGQKKGGSKSNCQGEIPENWSLELAEIYGALLGDGCIYSNMNSFCITGNADLDVEYLDYLQMLCKSIFSVEPKLNSQESENVTRLTLNSRKITRFLRDSGFKTGEKVGQDFELPSELQTDDKLRAVIRGLFDTDGGIYRHPYTGIMLDITAKNDSIHSILKQGSEKLNLPLGVTSDRVQLYGEEKIDRFMKEIGSSNSRNIKRHMYYKQNNRLPKADSEALLNSGPENVDVPYHGFMV